LPKAKASMLIANELGFSNVSGDSVKVSEITDEKKTANFSNSRFEQKHMRETVKFFNIS
jgi:hypothetical protein